MRQSFGNCFLMPEEDSTEEIQMKLKLSQFTVLEHDFPQKGWHILYNLLTRNLAKIDDKGWNVLAGLPSVPDDPHAQVWLDALAQGGFVVPAAANEGALHIESLERAKGDTAHLHVTLSLIQKCNFGCTYCYQGGAQSTHDGSKITKAGDSGQIKTDEIQAFLKSQCQQRGVTQLFFTAYGGEPLLNKQALLEIVSAMQVYCRKQGIRWAFDMVSNGSLLNRKTVLELKRYGFVKVQVTIDGNKETHNATRIWQNPKGLSIGTYDIIMRNLERWAGLIRTDVLCVVSKSNISAAHDLIDTLADRGLAKKQVRMMFAPINPTYDNETVAEMAQNFADNPDLLKTELEIVDAIAKLQVYAAQRGLIEDLRPRGTWCAVLRANGQNITITPEGKIYSCALFIGRDEKYSTGDISQDARGGLDALMKTFQYPDECQKCTYLPICANCRADALSTTGDIRGANSYKARYEVILPQLIRAHYRQLQQLPR
jgi:uncharacterized protein